MGFLSDIAGIAGGVLGFAVGGPAGAAIGASIGGAISGSAAQREAAEAGQQATDAAIAEQRAGREAFETRTQPFLDIGLAGGQQLQSFLEDPSQQLAEINPIVSFLREQGFEQIQESAAAQGRLGAGGTLRDLTRFDVGLTSTVVPQLQNQRFNQLFNVAGLGANVAAGQGTAAIQTGTNVSNLLSTAGRQEQAGILGSNQAILGGVENIGKAIGAFPNVFGGQPPPPVVPRAGGPAPVVDISTFG